MPTPYSSNTHTSHTANASDPEQDSNVQPPVTGGIGLRVESVAAKNAFEHTISVDSTAQQDPRLSSALASLRRIVERTQSDGSASSTDLTSNSLAKGALYLPRLDWEQVRTLLEQAEGPLLMRPPLECSTNIFHRNQTQQFRSHITCIIRKLLSEVSLYV